MLAASTSVPDRRTFTVGQVEQIAYKNGTETWGIDTSYGSNYTTVIPPSAGTGQTTFADGQA